MIILLDMTLFFSMKYILYFDYHYNSNEFMVYNKLKQVLYINKYYKKNSRNNIVIDYVIFYDVLSIRASHNNV